jgi:hypothetical protein
MKSALFILAYIKKLTLHPYLLRHSSLQQKKEIGLISKEEEMVLNEQLRMEHEALNSEIGIQTRRGKKETAAEKKNNKKKAKVEEEVIKLPELTKEEQEAKDRRVTMYDKFGMEKILSDINDMHDKLRVEDLVAVSSKTRFLFQLMG